MSTRRKDTEARLDALIREERRFLDWHRQFVEDLSYRLRCYPQLEPTDDELAKLTAMERTLL